MTAHRYFFFQAEDGIRDAQESRGLGDVYKRQPPCRIRAKAVAAMIIKLFHSLDQAQISLLDQIQNCLLYTSDAADDLLCVDLGGRRIIKKKKSYTDLLSLQYDKKLMK